MRHCMHERVHVAEHTQSGQPTQQATQQARASARQEAQGSDTQWTRAVHFSSFTHLTLPSALLPALWAAKSQALDGQRRVRCAGVHARAPACTLYCRELFLHRRHKSHAAAPRKLSRSCGRNTLIRQESNICTLNLCVDMFVIAPGEATRGRALAADA